MFEQFALSQIAATLLAGRGLPYDAKQAISDAVELWKAAGEHAPSLEAGEPIIPQEEMSVRS
jgi:hypothetical protein